MKELLQRIVEGAIILGILWLAQGCNTIHGFGEDVRTMSAPYVERQE